MSYAGWVRVEERKGDNQSCSSIAQAKKESSKEKREVHGEN